MRNMCAESHHGAMLVSLGRIVAGAAGVTAAGVVAYAGVTQFLHDSEKLAAGIQEEIQQQSLGQAA